MTSVDGWTYTYDAIGNPISKTNTNGETVEFTWSGRELTSWYSYDDGEIVKPMSFTYNADGIRTSKSYYDEVTEYVLDGSRIIAEIKNGSHIFVYIYDELGLPIGIKYRSSTTSSYEYFFFEKNLQGDIVAIYNDSGTKIASYVYDAWGNFTKTQTSGVTYSTADSYVYNNNPFTYRGYYYDSETGLYYLQTRYYDASIGRFINADGEMSGVGGNLIGYNLYAYGFNNPISMYDPTGEWPWLNWIVDFVVNIVDAILCSIETQVGVGIGIGVNIADTVKLDGSRDTYIGIDDGKLVTGNVLSTEVSILDSVGVGDEYDHRVEENFKRVSNSGTSYDSIFDIKNYPDVTRGNSISAGPVSVNSEGEVVISIGASAHFIFGGHAKFGFNITEFFQRLVD